MIGYFLYSRELIEDAGLILCESGHVTRRRRTGEWVLTCGCVVDLSDPASRRAMEEEGVSPDRFELVGEMTVSRERGWAP